MLEGCNIKLLSVASNFTVIQAKSMFKGIIDDAGDIVMIGKLAKSKLKNKQKELEKALLDLVGFHQKKILTAQLNHIELLDQQIIELDREIEARSHPFESELKLLDSIPRIGRKTAEDILAEISTAMSRFLSFAHLAPWVGMPPGKNESAGKRKSGKTTKGNKSLRTTLARAAHAAAKSNNTYLCAKYRRIGARRGGNRVAVTVGHCILVMAYNMLKKRETYKELCSDYFDQRKKDSVIKNSIKRLESQGLKVTVEAAA